MERLLEKYGDFLDDDRLLAYWVERMVRAGEEAVAAEAKSRVQDGGGNTQARTGQCHWTYALHPNFDKDK